MVAAVKLAIAERDVMPVEWYDLAIERQQVLRTRPPYQDEATLLDKAIKTWQGRRPENGKSAGFFQKLKDEFGWPGAKWIPRV